jgi:hypothetical protein
MKPHPTFPPRSVGLSTPARGSRPDRRTCRSAVIRCPSSRHDRTFPLGRSPRLEREMLGDYRFLHLAKASALRWWTGQFSMTENGSLALAARSDSCCRRTLHGIYSVVDRMQGSTCPFDRFGSNRPLHSTTGMHGTADTPRNKQPGEEPHLYPQATKRLCSQTTPAAHASAWKGASQVTDRPIHLLQAVPPGESTVDPRPGAARVLPGTGPTH